MGLFLCQPQSSEIVLGFVADSAEATGLKWATPAGGGKVLQVVEGTASTSVTNSTNTYADTNLTASITPSLATSKVLVIVAQGGCGKGAQNSGTSMKLRLMRDATQIQENDNFYTGTAIEGKGSIILMRLDTPATTSSITYKTQFKNTQNAAAVFVQGDSSSSIVLMEIGA